MKIDSKDPQTWVSRDLFAAYCGPGSDKLLSYYDKAVHKKNVMSFSLNWLAIVILPAWLGYRKQWQLLAALTVMCASLPFIEGLFGFNIPTAGLTGGLVATACMANGLLLMSANTLFLKLGKNGMNLEQIRAAIAGRASSSVSMAIAATVSFMLCQVVAVLVADTLFRAPV